MPCAFWKMATTRSPPLPAGRDELQILLQTRHQFQAFVIEGKEPAKGSVLLPEPLFAEDAAGWNLFSPPGNITRTLNCSLAVRKMVSKAAKPKCKFSREAAAVAQRTAWLPLDRVHAHTLSSSITLFNSWRSMSLLANCK